MAELSLQSLFVGREYEQQSYQELLNGSSRWVLVITGQGGNGKTALLRRFKERTPADTPVVMLNFANGLLVVDPLVIMEKLVEQLAPYCNERQVQQWEKALQEGRDVLSANRQMNEIIIASEHATVTENTQSMSAVSREQRSQMYEKVRKACYNLLDSFRLSGLVIMLDTCERLNELEGSGLSEIGQWVMNELVTGLHARLRQKHRGCLVVIASRMQPQLEAIDEDEMGHLSLAMLDEPAVEEYLQHLGMQDATLRKHVYKVTHGHALCVSIIGSLWQERGGQPFTIADLPVLQEKFNQRALLKFIGERVLDKRLKSPYKELTRYGVLLRSFDLPLLQAVFPKLLAGEDALDRWHHLIRYPYIEYLGNYRYAFHDLLREIQAEEIRTQEFQKWLDYHKHALDYLTQTSPYSPEWYYHELAFNEEQGMSDWWDAVQEVQIRGRRESFDALLQAAQDSTLRLSVGAYAQITFWQGKFYYYGGQMQAALASYEQALKLFQQVGSKLGEANVRKAMGDVQQFRDDREAALASYEQALKLFQQVGDRLGEANVLQAMGDVQQFRDDREAALASYEQALKLFQQVGSKLGEANCYLAQGRLALEQEDNSKALALHTDAYQLYQRIQDRYSQMRLLYYRSWVYEAMDEPQLAIEDMEKALAIAQSLGLPFLDLFRERLDNLRTQ